MPTYSFKLNGKRVSVDAEADERMLWVIRDQLGVTGPKHGCAIGVCQACTSHVNGTPVNLCCIPIKDMRSTDEVTTIEGLPATVGKELHPMQQAWLDLDVAQCGYCQPGQIMAAVGLVNRVRAEGRSVTEADIDTIRNLCRCGTYSRIREAIKQGEAAMPKKTVKAKAKRKVRRRKRRTTKPHAAAAE